MASQAKDSGSNPDGSIMLSLKFPQYSHAYNNFQFDEVTILENQGNWLQISASHDMDDGLWYGNHQQIWDKLKETWGYKVQTRGTIIKKRPQNH